MEKESREIKRPSEREGVIFCFIKTENYWLLRTENHDLGFLATLFSLGER